MFSIRTRGKKRYLKDRRRKQFCYGKIECLFKNWTKWEHVWAFNFVNYSNTTIFIQHNVGHYLISAIKRLEAYLMTIYWLPSQLRLKLFRILIKLLDDVLRLRRSQHLQNSIFFISLIEISTFSAFHTWGRSYRWLCRWRSFTSLFRTACLSKEIFEFFHCDNKGVSLDLSMFRCYENHWQSKNNNIFSLIR